MEKITVERNLDISTVLENLNTSTKELDQKEEILFETKPGSKEASIAAKESANVRVKVWAAQNDFHNILKFIRKGKSKKLREQLTSADFLKQGTEIKGSDINWLETSGCQTSGSSLKGKTLYAGPVINNIQTFYKKCGNISDDGSNCLKNGKIPCSVVHKEYNFIDDVDENNSDKKNPELNGGKNKGFIALKDEETNPLILPIEVKVKNF